MNKRKLKTIPFLMAVLFALSTVFYVPIVSAAQFNTNLENGKVLSGSWTLTDVLTAKGDGDSFYIASNNMSDLLYSADINITSPAGAAAMFFRSSSDASKCYVVNFEIGTQKVRLFKFPYTGDNCNLGSYSTKISSNTTYNLAVRAIGSNIAVFFNHQRVIDVTDSTYSSGVVGLNIWSSTSTFQNVYVNDGTMKSAEPVSVETYIGTKPQLPSTVAVNFDNNLSEQFNVTWDAIKDSDIAQIGSFQVSGTVDNTSLTTTATVDVKQYNTNLQGGKALSGTWTPGGTLTGSGDGDNFYMATNNESDVLYSADINIKSAGGAAALIFRSSADASKCYVVNFDLGQKNVRLFKFPYSGDLGSYSTNISSNTTYNLAVRAIGNHISVYWNHVKVIDATDSTYSSGVVGMNVWCSTTSFQNIYVGNGSVQSIDNVAVSTFADNEPVLPKTVNVNFANNITEKFAVTWDSIDSSKLSSVGTFTVNGTVADTDVKAVANITVKGFKSNLPDTNVLSGSWDKGDVLRASGGGDCFLMSSSNTSDTLYSADINMVSGEAAALIFRSDSNASHCYVANFDVVQQNVRLFRFPHNSGNDDLGLSNVSISNNKTYNLAVRAIGNRIMVYFDHKKVIDVTDTAYTSGFAGLNIFSGTADFQNVYINDGSVQGVENVSINTYVGMKKALPDSVRVNFKNSLYELFPVKWDNVDSSKWNQAGTFTVNGTVCDANTTATATVNVTALSGRTIKSIEKVSDMNVSYPTAVDSLNLPSSLTVTLDNDIALPMDVQWDTAGYQDKDGAYKLTGTVKLIPSVTNPDNIKANVNVTVSGESTYYREAFRPQYHFTPAKSWLNDPNGLVYYNGEYHLFYQYNPNDTVWGPMYWGHAVSTDLTHWTHLPIALEPDSIGTMYSGSAVVDTKDTSGFFGGSSGLVSIFSYSTQKVGIAYSKDNGRTWEKYSGNPVIPNPGEADFRDPKVFWYAPTNKWIMVVAGGKLHVYSSPNLKDWTLESKSDSIVTECPDLFELPVDGNSNNKKWVLNLGGLSYYIGSFDGHKFTPESQRYAINYGSDCYASQTYSDTDGRRIMISWMNNWSYAAQLKSNAWNGTMTVPYELSLKTASDNTVRLYQMPVDEINALHKDSTKFNGATVTQGTNILKNLRGKALDITAEFKVSGTSKFGFKVLKSSNGAGVISYNAATNTLTLDRSQLENMGISSLRTSKSCTLKPVNNVIKLRILVDNSTIEVFGNDGEVVMTDLAFPDAQGNGLELYTEGGDLQVNSLNINQMNSSWRNEATNAKISLSSDSLNLNIGENHEITSIVTPLIVSDSKVTWTVKDENIAGITVSDYNKIVVKGKSAGTTTIVASTFDGKVLAECSINVKGSGNSSQDDSSINNSSNNTSSAGNSNKQNSKINNSTANAKTGESTSLPFVLLLYSGILSATLLVLRQKIRKSENHFN